MRVYLSGPMRGIPKFNFPAFHEAADSLRAAGHFVFSPAEADIERHGTDISIGNETGDEDKAATEHGFSLRDSLLGDITWIIRHAEAIALMPNWQHSKGAKAEKAVADALGLEVIYL
jgi:Domain of unknown function (DUF4406)